MAEHHRALIVVLALSAVAFAVAGRALCPGVFSLEDFRRRRNVWFGVTLVGFLSDNFWLYAIVMSMLLVWTARREHNRFALYCLLLFALPPLDAKVPGLGLVNYFVDLNHIRLLNLVLLLPLALKLANQPQPETGRLKLADVVFGAYVCYRFGIRVPEESLTMSMRTMFGLLLDDWLVYYVASRSLTDVKRAKDIVGSFVLGIAVLGPIAAFESARGWLVYDGLRAAWDLPPASILQYLRRSSGLLRANVTGANTIVAGYMFMVALTMMIFVYPFVRRGLLRWMAVAVMLAGLLFTLSRGPWVGAAVGLLVGGGIGPGALRRWRWVLLATVLIATALALTPFGDDIIAHLPFIGTVDADTVTYRQRLFDVSMTVFWQNPLFGSVGYIFNPVMEQMRQGQGIIDMVNTYLIVGLGYGLVGLVLFVAPFILALAVVLRRRAILAKQDPDAERLGRALLATVLAIMLTIATVSNIFSIPTVYTLVIGLCISYGQILRVPSGEVHATKNDKRDGVEPWTTANVARTQ